MFYTLFDSTKIFAGNNKYTIQKKINFPFLKKNIFSNLIFKALESQKRTIHFFCDSLSIKNKADNKIYE